MKKLHLVLGLAILGGFFIPGIVSAQNINTDTTSTTVGSTQFGVVLSPVDLQRVMQSSVALTCAGPVDARVCTPGAAQGTGSAFVRLSEMPGSFTDNPTGTVSVLPNFACGETLDAATCHPGNMFFFGAAPGEQAQTAPNFTGRQLVGNINSNVVIGDGGATAGMPDGFMAFTLDPATGNMTLDQLITHTVDLGGGSLMVFNQRDATIGTGNLIPDPIGGPLTLVPFVAANTQDIVQFFVPSIGLVNRMTLAQGDADGFGGLNLDVQVNFTGRANFPLPSQYVTPGLNTGRFQTVFSPSFGSEFDGFLFP